MYGNTKTSKQAHFWHCLFLEYTNTTWLPLRSVVSQAGLSHSHVLNSILLTNHRSQYSKCWRMFSFPVVNTASIGSFFSFLTVMQRSLETKMEGLEKDIHKLFVWRHNVLGYMKLKMYEFKMNLSKKQKWQDTACCRNWANIIVLVFLSVKGELLYTANTCPAQSTCTRRMNMRLFVYWLNIYIYIYIKVNEEFPCSDSGPMWTVYMYQILPFLLVTIDLNEI